MLKRAYAKGYTLEQKIKKELELFYPLVIRSAGSKGPIDLAALNLDGWRLIQAKNSEYISKHEKEKLLKLSKRIDTPIYVYLKHKIVVIK